MAQHHIFLALSNPRAAREEEFHTWYDAHHLQDVVDYCRGFERGQRYWAAADQPGAESPRWSSLAIYELEADDVAQLHLDVSAGAGRFTPSNGVFDDDHVAWVYSPLDTTAAAIALPSGDGSRSLLLAFSEDKPPVEAMIGKPVSRQLLERHPDQRGGIIPPWRYLTVASVRRADASAFAQEYAAATRPAAIWLFEGHGFGTVATQNETADPAHRLTNS